MSAGPGYRHTGGFVDVSSSCLRNLEKSEFFGFLIVKGKRGPDDPADIGQKIDERHCAEGPFTVDRFGKRLFVWSAQWAADVV